MRGSKLVSDQCVWAHCVGTSPDFREASLERALIVVRSPLDRFRTLPKKDAQAS
jgi:hypothetical protein